MVVDGGKRGFAEETSQASGVAGAAPASSLQNDESRASASVSDANRALASKSSTTKPGRVPTSFASLCQLLEGVSTQSAASRASMQLDPAVFHDMLDFFKPPSEASRRRVTDKKATLTNGQDITLSDPEKSIALALCSRIEVKEEQCCEMVRQYLRSKLSMRSWLKLGDGTERPFRDAGDIQLDDLVRFYLGERLAMLRCVALLVRHSSNDDHFLSSASAIFVDRLLGASIDDERLSQRSGELLDLLIDQLGRNTSEKIPAGYAHTSQWQNEWVSHVLAERQLILQLLFSLFYERLRCDTVRLTKLVRISQTTNMARRTATAPFNDDKLRGILQDNTNLFVVLLISCLRLEDFLDIDADHLPALSPLDPNFAELHNTILSLADKDFNSPLLMAWCTVLQSLYDATLRFPQRWPGLVSEQAMGMLKSAISFSARSFSLNCVDVIVRILQSPPFVNDNDVTSVVVMKGLLMLFINTFNVDRLPNLHSLMEYACLVFNKAPVLCTQFWEQDIFYPGCRSLLQVASSRFPANGAQLPKLLSALSHGLVGATTVASRLADLPTFTSLLPDAFDTSLYARESHGDASSPSHVRTLDRVAVGPGGLIVLPPGTYGIVMPHSQSMGPYAEVQWQHPISVWRWFYALLASYSGARPSPTPFNISDLDTIDSVFHLLQVLYNVLSAPTLRDTLVGHIDGSDLSASMQDVRRPSLLSTLLLFAARLCVQCTTAPPTRPGELGAGDLLKLAGVALRCAAAALPSYPSSVVLIALRQCELLPPTLQGTLHRLLATREGPVGTYPVTSAFLDLMTAVMQHCVLSPAALAEASEAEMARAAMGSSKVLSDTMSSPARSAMQASARATIRQSTSIMMMSTSSFAAPNEASVNLELRDEFLNACLSYCLRHLFVAFDTWRFLHIRDKFEIGGKLLGLLVSAINEPSPAWLRSMIREHFLGNSGIYLINPLLAIIGNASSLTDRLQSSQRAMDAGEVDTLVAHAFKLVLALLGGPRSELLEHAIQECKVGEDQSDLVFLITGFALVRSPSSELPLLALRTLSTLCSAKDPRGQVVSLIGYFGPNPSAYCAEFVQMLGQPDVSEAVQEAVIQFLRAALPFQTALTLQFLNGSPLPEAPSKGTERIEGVPQSSVLTVLVQLVSKVTDGSYPDVSVAALAYLVELWAWRQHPAALAPIASNPSVWSALMSVLGDEHGSPSLTPVGRSTENVAQFVRSNRCLAQTLSLVALQLEQLPATDAPAASAAHTRAWDAAIFLVSANWRTTWTSKLLRAFITATSPPFSAHAALSSSLMEILGAYCYLMEVVVNVSTDPNGTPAGKAPLLDSATALSMLKAICTSAADDSETLSLPTAALSVKPTVSSDRDDAVMQRALVKLASLVPLLVRVIITAAETTPKAVPAGGASTASPAQLTANAAEALTLLSSALNTLPASRASFDASLRIVIIEPIQHLLLQACGWILRGLLRRPAPNPHISGAADACAVLVIAVHDALRECLALRPEFIESPERQAHSESKSARGDVAAASRKPATALLIPLLTQLVDVLATVSSSAEGAPVPAWAAAFFQSGITEQLVALSLSSISKAATEPTQQSSSADEAAPAVSQMSMATPRHALLVLQLLLKLSATRALADLLLSQRVLSQFVNVAYAIIPRVALHTRTSQTEVPPPTTEWDMLFMMLLHLANSVMAHAQRSQPLADQLVSFAQAFQPVLVSLTDRLPLPPQLPPPSRGAFAFSVSTVTATDRSTAPPLTTHRGLTSSHVALHQVALLFAYHFGRCVVVSPTPSVSDPPRVLFETLAANVMDVIHQAVHMLSHTELMARFAGVPSGPSSETKAATRALRSAVTAVLQNAIAVAWLLHTSIPSSAARAAAAMPGAAARWNQITVAVAPTVLVAATERAILGTPPSVGTLLTAVKLLIGDTVEVIEPSAMVAGKAAGLRSAPPSAPPSAPGSPRLGAAPGDALAMSAEQAFSLALSLVMQLQVQINTQVHQPGAAAQDPRKAQAELVTALRAVHNRFLEVMPAKSKSAAYIKSITVPLNALAL